MFLRYNLPSPPLEPESALAMTCRDLFFKNFFKLDLTIFL